MMLASMTYGNWFPPMLSTHGGQVDRLIDIVHYFMAILFVGWGLFFLYCLFFYRQRSGHKASYELIKAKQSKYAEVAIIVIELILLFAFSMPVWANYKNKPPTLSEGRVEIRVIAQQFQWNIQYPGKDGIFGKVRADLVDEAANPIGLDREGDPNAKDDVVTNEMHLPVGVPVYVRLSTKDVIHSFDIPTLRVKQDVIPGMEIPIWFTVQEDATSEKLLNNMRVTLPVEGLDWYKWQHYVAAADVTDKSGEVRLKQNDGLGFSLREGNATLDILRKAGITSLTMQPHHPLELVCAQLCGNSHFKMKAAIYTHTKADFDAWVAKQVEAAGGTEFEF